MATSTNSIRKTYHGIEHDLPNGMFQFTTEDIDKYIVIAFPYEEHLFWYSPFGTQLRVNGNILSTHKRDNLYGVYQIKYHSWCKETKDVSYKIKLVPVGDWGAWCPDRSWYTHDLESSINHMYNLFEENPLFDNYDEAAQFALKKNFELYPDKRSLFKKLIDRIFNKQ